LSTKYEEMCDAARNAVNEASNYRERCWNYLASLVNGLSSYCTFPQESVRMLKWNELDGPASAYEEPESGGVYNVIGAATLDNEGFWRLGIRLALVGMVSVSFPICVAEQNGQTVVKVGSAGRIYKVDPSDQNACTPLYDEVVQKVITSFADPKRPRTKVIGFTLQ
jgi:hypothetical protein